MGESRTTTTAGYVCGSKNVERKPKNHKMERKVKNRKIEKLKITTSEQRTV